MTASIHTLSKPNPDAMRQHVEHLFGGYLDGYHDGLIELSWTDIRPDEAGRHALRSARLFKTDEIDALLAEAARLNAQPMCNVYIGAALRKPETAPFGRAKDSDAFVLTAAYVDLDDEGAAVAAKDIYGKIKPTLVVVTGHAPHTRAQLWWRLDEPMTDPEQWSALIKGMAAALRGDPTVANPSRVMRLAGTVAWPVKEGRTVETTQIIPIKEPGQNVYSFSHLAALFPPIHTTGAAPRPGTGPVLAGNVTHRTNSLGLPSDIIDGRETYMRDTLAAALIEFAGTTGAAPTAQELFDAAWPQYERNVDLTRPGRGADEFRRKCAYTVARFEKGEIRGIPTLDAAIDIYRNKTQARATAPRPEAAPGFEPPADDSTPILVSDFTGKPPEREWIVPDWLPKGVVSSLSGDGGVGKTLIAQQLLYASGCGGKWLGLDIPKLKGLGVFCEDDEDELHRRHIDIKSDLGYAVGNPFDSTWVWPRVGSDNLLVTFDRENRPLMSPFFAQIMRHVMERRIELLILDTVADLFGGNEIIRAQVNYFIKSACGSFIAEAKKAGFTLSVLLLSHPSQAGRNSGSGESGSTAWNNAVRARLYLTRPEDGLPEQRVLTRKKSNYSASGDDVKIELIWQEGVLRPVAGSDKGVVIKSTENQILHMVRSAWESGYPYKAKKDTEKFLDGEMIREFAGRVEMGVIVTALKNLKGRETIVVEREGRKRGWRPVSVENEEQPIEE
jgi:RecA-family ATPase